MLLFRSSVMSDSLWSHGLQHARLPCPSLSLRVCSNSCPLRRGYHPTISSSVTPFSFCLQSFPASGSFLMSQLFISGGQRIGVPSSASVLPMNQLSSVQLLSHVRLFATPWTAASVSYIVLSSNHRIRYTLGSYIEDSVIYINLTLWDRTVQLFIIRPPTYFCLFFFFWSCVCRTLALPDQGLNPHSLQQECGVLTTGRLGKASLMF